MDHDFYAHLCPHTLSIRAAGDSVLSGGMYGDTSLTNVTCLVSKQVVSYFFINERAPFPSPEGLHSASSSLALLLLTPSQLQPVQGGKMQSYTHANSIFDGPITNLLSILCVLIHISSRAHPKGGKMP